MFRAVEINTENTSSSNTVISHADFERLAAEFAMHNVETTKDTGGKQARSRSTENKFFDQNQVFVHVIKVMSDQSETIVKMTDQLSSAELTANNLRGTIARLSVDLRDETSKAASGNSMLNDEIKSHSETTAALKSTAEELNKIKIEFQDYKDSRSLIVRILQRLGG